MEWSHTVLGRFDISEQWLGLDLRNLFLDPVRAETTLFHETTHSLIGRTTDSGQAMQNIAFFASRFKHLSDEQQKEIQILLKESQVFVQEGFATFMEMQALRRRVSWDAVQIAKGQMHPAYLERFEKMEFMFGQSHKNRERFTKKVSLLVMEAGLRRNAPTLDLLRSPQALKTYLDDDKHNPSKRLEKVLAALRKNPRIVREKPRKMARMCELEFFEPATKEEVATFVNYLLGLAGMKQDYTVEFVGRTVGQEVLQDTMDKLLVTNMNLDLSNNGMVTWKTEDIEYEATHAQTAFIVHHSSLKYDAFLGNHFNRKFEIDLILFGKNGEKYLAVTSMEHVQKLLLDKLKSATVLTKWGICNPVDSSFDISDKRKPDVIIYNTPADMLAAFERNRRDIKKYEYIHLGMSKDHPFQSLLVKVNGQDTIHFVNGFGNAGIVRTIEFMKPKGKNIKPKELLPHARAINDTLATMGMPWDIDWVATIIDQKAIIRR